MKGAAVVHHAHRRGLWDVPHGTIRLIDVCISNECLGEPVSPEDRANVNGKGKNCRRAGHLDRSAISGVRITFFDVVSGRNEAVDQGMQLLVGHWPVDGQGREGALGSLQDVARSIVRVRRAD